MGSRCGAHKATFQSARTCSPHFLDQDLTGVDVAVTTVIGNSAGELDSLCCMKCDANADCEFWVREEGLYGSKQCWLKKEPGNFVRDGGRRGAFKVEDVEEAFDVRQAKIDVKQQPGQEARCSAHAACAKLSGFCCPTAAGLKLGCCSETLPESPDSHRPVAAANVAANVMTLYHTTSSTVAEAIVASNFRPGSNGWCGGAIYFLDFPGLPTAKMDPVHSQTGAVIEATVDLGKVCVIEKPAGCLDGSSGKCCPAPNGAGFGTTGAALAGCNSIKWNPGDGWEYVIWEPERVLSKKVACSGRSACLKACQARGHSLTECGGQ